MTIKKCGNCNHNQDITFNDIYEDIAGKYIICEKCNIAYGIETNEEGEIL